MTDNVSSIYDQYWRHASTLRGWFIAYGIGALVIVMSNKAVFDSLKPDNIKSLATWFIAGVAIQVVLAYFNKIYNYYYFFKRTTEY